ncbi:hypothetical protein Nepgr_024869 [Nepenthes gracilis]|uniref:SAM domain-containing protein n=1 Tax=Nepenthes gracilis TaxID=150966 RepID=A0AAD3Y0X3_NEPGR|nr:hypothetical protein Nepgr_024869 [Nepenthes gracilis]
MVKPRHKQLGVMAANNSGNAKDLVGASDVAINNSGEDGWVLVKKQRVLILIPPLPGTKLSTVDNPQPGQLPEGTPREVVNGTSEPPTRNPSEVQPIVKNGKPMSAGKDVPVAMENPTKPEMGKSNAHKIIHQNKSGASITRKPCIDHRIWRTVEPSKLYPHRVDQMLRASNLRCKLARAGGLNQWLKSLGLEQFIRVFQRRKLSNFQLVNLSMKKLKDMGAHAVGPRRKLMHAIDCLGQPYCFEVL